MISWIILHSFLLDWVLIYITWSCIHHLCLRWCSLWNAIMWLLHFELHMHCGGTSGCFVLPRICGRKFPPWFFTQDLLIIWSWFSRECVDLWFTLVCLPLPKLHNVLFILYTCNWCTAKNSYFTCTMNFPLCFFPCYEVDAGCFNAHDGLGECSSSLLVRDCIRISTMHIQYMTW